MQPTIIGQALQGCVCCLTSEKLVAFTICIYLFRLVQEHVYHFSSFSHEFGGWLL